ncbi:MAG: S1/P1 nuclease [Flavobacteriaceae bacterium]|nr:S1/P1 nuclease [Flavobacteriaceae bacterium]
MKAIYFWIALLLLNTGFLCASEDWGRTGHRATGEIAQSHLTKKAEKRIKELLDGASLAFVSTYADEIKSDEKYRPYGPWHYVNFPFDTTYEDHPKSDRGDIIRAIETCINVLKDDAATKEDKAFHLKLLVHFMGDLHQPLHIGKAEDKGANTFQVRWFDDGTNLHTVWDTKMIESYNMSYSELAANADAISKEQIEQMQQGSVTDWMYESRALCLDIYENTEIGEKLGYRYMYRYVNTMRAQLQKGGVRLAGVLNEIFG